MFFFNNKFSIIFNGSVIVDVASPRLCSLINEWSRHFEKSYRTTHISLLVNTNIKRSGGEIYVQSLIVTQLGGKWRNLMEPLMLQSAP